MKDKAPSVRQTIIHALESGQVLTNGSANSMTQSSEGSRTIRRLRQEGYPIEERKRPNKIRSGSIKEFFYSPATINRIQSERMVQGNLFK